MFQPQAHHSRNTWLDILRSVAITLVLLSHGRIFLTNKLPFTENFKLGGYWGVELFFVLSGFLIGRILYESFFDSPKWVLNFLVRRWFRTLPNYFLFLAIKVLLLGIGIGVAYDNILPFLTFTQNLAWRHPEFFPEAWSLSVEEVFYLLVPIILTASWKFLRKFGLNFHHIALTVITVFSLFSIGLRLYCADTPNVMWDADIRKVVIFRFDSLMFGFLTYIAWAKSTIMLPATFLALGGALLLAASAIIALELIDLNVSYFAKTGLFSVTTIGFCLILLSGMRFNIYINNQLIKMLFKKVSMYSYSIYLSHLTILEIVKKTIDNQYFALSIWLCLTLLISALIYEYFEKTLLNYRDENFPAFKRM